LEVVRTIAASLPLVLVLTLAAACGGSSGDEAEGTAEALPLEGVQWILTSGITVDGWETVAPTAAFAEGSLAGSTGCNRYNAAYTTDGEALEIGAVASTRMACPPPADAVERDYLVALEQVARHRLEASELVLLDAEGAELLRYAAGP
jgi:heat shock protein HslJ